MKRTGLIAIVLGSLLCGSLWADEPLLKPGEKRALKLKPAVVLIAVELNVKWFQGSPFEVEIPETAFGTGFLYRPDGYLVTNGHVVADANARDVQAIAAVRQRLTQEFIDQLKKGNITAYIEGKIHRKLTQQDEAEIVKQLPQWIPRIESSTIHVFLQNGKDLKGDILVYSPPSDMGGKDVAILKIPSDNLPTVKLGNSDNVRLQDPIMAMGYPGLASRWGNLSASGLISAESNLEPSATNGHISALKTEYIGTPLLQSDVAIFHGNSGGPAFNNKGEVIGIPTAGAQESQGFNFLVPINTAWEFIRQAGAPPDEGAFNRHWAAALDLYDEGKCSHAMAEFDNVAQVMPGLKDAQKYRGLALECWDNKNLWQKMTEYTGVWPPIVIPLIIVLGVVAWMVMGKSSAHKVPATVGAPPPIPVQITGQAPAQLPAQGNYGRIQFTSGALSGRTFPITKEGLWIGRDPQCGVVLQDDSISAQHAWIVPADGNIVVIDKGSTNGTYVNSTDSPRISKVGLRNGDRVYLGHKGSVFTYFVS